MNVKFRWLPVMAAAVLLALTGCGKQEAPKADKVAADVKAAVKAVEADAKELEAREIAIAAYEYAYPLVTMEITRRVMTNVEKPEGSKAPMGQFARLRTYPAVDDHSVTAPNADTLYTLAWLDLTKEPWILSLPDTKDRYYLFPMLDGWTNVFQVPGKRTTGTKAQKYALTGPGWTGTLPAGVTEYKAPTNMVWLLGRIYSTGTPEDYKAVHALQDQVSAVPLSSYGKPYTPPPGKVDPTVDMKTAPRDQVNAMDGASYFKLFAELLKSNPPAADDAPMVAKMAKIGIVPGQDFDVSKLDPAVAKGIAAAPKPAQEKISSLGESGRFRQCQAGARLALLPEDRHLRHQLSQPRADHLVRTRRQPAGGRGVPDLRGPRADQEVQRREQVRGALQEGRNAARQRVLVDHDVRQELLLRTQPDQPLHGQLAQQVQDQCGWLGRPLHPEGVARQGQGTELAACAGRRVRADDEAVLAQARSRRRSSMAAGNRRTSLR